MGTFDDLDKSAIFRRAAEIVRERGWGMGSEAMYGRLASDEDAKGPVCILGGCNLAMVEQYGASWWRDLGAVDPYPALRNLSFYTSLKDVLNLDNDPWVWNDSTWLHYDFANRLDDGKQLVIDALEEAAAL